MQWWRDAKFGLFIHYGLYSILGKDAWVMFLEPDEEEYNHLQERFTCEKFSGKKWVEAAKDAGCRYMVVTTRHHDGFSLFDSKISDYNAVNSPAKRDLIAEYVNAAREADMKIGFYYSPMDWRYPGFFFPDMYRSNAEKMKKQTYIQVRELLTNYGKIDILWWDGASDDWLACGGLYFDVNDIQWHSRAPGEPYTGKFSWEPLKLNKMVRDLQPGIVINPRSGWMGDFQTQEGHLKGKTSDRPWELCTTIDGAWGWTFGSAGRTMGIDSCIRLLITVVCQDGNLLLNVGPKPDGEIEPVQVQRLKEMGTFLSRYGESVYNTRGIFFDPGWGGTTENKEALYVHILKVPDDGTLVIPYKGKKIISARSLTYQEKVPFRQSETVITLTGIRNKQNATDLIVKLSFR